MKVYNVLILDDVELTGENIRSRMICVNGFYTDIKIIPHYISFDIKNIPDAAKEIAKNIRESKIDYLLLDRGFSSVLNPEEEKSQNLDSERLWAEKGSVWIKDILREIPKETYHQIKGIIIYTYDPRVNHPDSRREVIQDECLKVLPKKFNEDNFDIFRSFTEIYELADLRLKPYPPADSLNYRDMGKKSDLKLYGLFMGEILYHRVISMIKSREKKRLIEKRGFLLRNLIVWFLALTGLSVGGNALYNILAKYTDIYLLIMLSVVFSFFIPLLILLIKKELLIPTDKEDS